MILDAARFAIRLTRDHFQQRDSGALPERPAQWLDTVRAQGLCIVPGYLDSQACMMLREEVTRLNRDCPAAVHVRSNGADRRIFGADTASAAISEFGQDAELAAIARAAIARDAVNAFTLAGAITYRQENIGSGEGWHRDSFFGQFKALVYLTDVSIDEGPFEFILGSHRTPAKLRDHVRYDIPLASTRITDIAVGKLVEAEPERLITVTGPAGTLVLADTTAIHRGRPLNAGARMALTNYYYAASRLAPAFYDHFKPVLGRHVAVRP